MKPGDMKVLAMGSIAWTTPPEDNTSLSHPVCCDRDDVVVLISPTMTRYWMVLVGSVLLWVYEAYMYDV